MLIFNYLEFCSIEGTEVTAQIEPNFPADLMRLPWFSLNCVLIYEIFFVSLPFGMNFYCYLTIVL